MDFERGAGPSDEANSLPTRHARMLLAGIQKKYQANMGFRLRRNNGIEVVQTKREICKQDAAER